VTDYRCNDCGIDVLASGDWYMATPEVWKGLGLGWDDNLCVACLEKRLGRAARPWDDVLPIVGVGPERLSDRLMALFAETKAGADGPAGDP
jgi:hypothetical protein